MSDTGFLIYDYLLKADGKVRIGNYSGITAVGLRIMPLVRIYGQKEYLRVPNNDPVLFHGVKKPCRLSDLLCVNIGSDQMKVPAARPGMLEKGILVEPRVLGAYAIVPYKQEPVPVPWALVHWTLRTARDSFCFPENRDRAPFRWELQPVPENRVVYQWYAARCMRICGQLKGPNALAVEVSLDHEGAVMAMSGQMPRVYMDDTGGIELGPGIQNIEECYIDAKQVPIEEFLTASVTQRDQYPTTWHREGKPVEPYANGPADTSIAIRPCEQTLLLRRQILCYAHGAEHPDCQAGMTFYLEDDGAYRKLFSVRNGKRWGGLSVQTPGREDVEIAEKDMPGSIPCGKYPVCPSLWQYDAVADMTSRRLCFQWLAPGPDRTDKVVLGTFYFLRAPEGTAFPSGLDLVWSPGDTLGLRAPNGDILNLPTIKKKRP